MTPDNLRAEARGISPVMFDSTDHDNAAVLLALGNPSEAVQLEQHLSTEFPDTMEIYRAPSGFDAMSLAMNKPRIVLLDQRLPDVMGLDMIDPIRDQIGKDNYLIFIGGSGKGGMRPGMRDEALKRGASAICDRPIDFGWLTQMIRQLLFPEVPDHPHLHGLELMDLIQMFHQKRCDRTMRIFARDGRVGSIYMNRGEVTHVEAGAMHGFNAILDLMQWTEGRIQVYDAILSSERTNKVPTMHLIMEAARIMDEGFADNGAKNALDAMSDDSGEVLPPSAAQLRSSAANHRPDSGGGVATGSDSNRFSIPSIDLESRDES
jgi:CheY-like chemotaxis protein